MSSPGGRAKYRQMMNRTSPSPSPRRSVPSLTAHREAGTDQPIDDDGEEDEETLQLQLQEIQARLKLKRLQKAKENKPANGGSGNAEFGTVNGSPSLAPGTTPETLHPTAQISQPISRRR